jgi:hypothetical protein
MLGSYRTSLCITFDIMLMPQVVANAFWSGYA